MRFPFTGVIPVDKPRGVTSRRVVDVVGRALSMRAVGHAGTLDPLASGVVIVCVGQATKLVDYLHDLPKHYTATFLLGQSSPSDDLETAVEFEENPLRPSLVEVEKAADGFRGDIWQRPCDYSAVHVDGKRAYRLARAGRVIEIDAKPVSIDSLTITNYQWPLLSLNLICSSGTFVRALGRDLAESLGTKALMASLVRSAIGTFCIENSLPLVSFESGQGGSALASARAEASLLPPLAAVEHMPRRTLDADTLALAIRGIVIVLPDGSADAVAAVDSSGVLVGILRKHSSGGYRLKPNFLGH